jgi:hypothetical protein
VSDTDKSLKGSCEGEVNPLFFGETVSEVVDKKHGFGTNALTNFAFLDI